MKEQSLENIIREKRPRASEEALVRLEEKGIEEEIVRSFLPVVNSVGVIGKKLSEWIQGQQMKVALMNHKQRDSFRKSNPVVLFPDHQKYKKAIVKDKLTGEEMGTLYYDRTPEKWVAFYYQSMIRSREEDGQKIAEWFGCMAVNISPIDGLLGFESASGQDSRDFRGNFQVSKAIQEENIKARYFNTEESKFELEIIQ